MIIINALIFGAIVAVLIGPVFFTLIQTSLEKGLDKAILVAVGITLSDIIYILLAHLGVSQFLDNSGYKEWIGVFGGIVLIIFGIVNFIKPAKSIQPSSADIEVKGFFRYIFKGLAINGISPFVLVFWLGAMSAATAEYGYTGSDLLLFFGLIVAIVFITDVTKAYLANRLRKFLTIKFLKRLNIAVGITLILFGIRMFTYQF